MLDLVADRGCGYVLMHIEGPPRVDRQPPGHRDPVAHLKRWFQERIESALERGVAEEQIALDPGLDFDLSVDDDLEVLRRLDELRELGRPLFVALSRKDFLGAVLAGILGGPRPGRRTRVGDRGGDDAGRGRRGRDGAAPRPQRARRAAHRRRDQRPPRNGRAALDRRQ